MSTRAWLALALVACGLVGAWIFLAAQGGHRRPPHPRGMVMRLEARAVEHPMDRILVEAGAGSDRTICVETKEIDGLFRVVQHRFPSGERIAEWRTPSMSPAIEIRRLEAFDMDGDGSVDRVETPAGIRMGYGTVRVISGRDARVLFEDSDPLEYECCERAFALPDLDGDGCSELALVHPRQDRSRYDLEIWDMLLGAKSWITLVSGREATR